MNSKDFYKIRDFAKSGGYYNRPGTIFVLPSMDYSKLEMVAKDGIDWDRLMDDYVNALFGKLGSFADDWYFTFAPEEGQIDVSQPGLLEKDCLDNDFMATQKVVLRKLKLRASKTYIFPTSSWREFEKYVRTGGYMKTPFEYITDDFAEKARLHGDYGFCGYDCYGKLPYLKYEKELRWEREYFRLDDMIALHRNGKYTLPGKRINFQDLKYADGAEEDTKEPEE